MDSKLKNFLESERMRKDYEEDLKTTLKFINKELNTGTEKNIILFILLMVIVIILIYYGKKVYKKFEEISVFVKKSTKEI